MAAALLLGNLALLVDASSQWTPPPDRAPGKSMAVAKRDPLLPLLSAALGKPFHDPDSFSDPPRIAANRRKGAAAAAGFDGGSDGGGSGGGGDDWEEKLRIRLKEMEEMKELERSAEELQSRVAEEEGEGPETEEVKRERVRRELEKVAREQAERRKTAKLMFDLGQKAYGRGMYARAIEFLEAALTIIPRPTMLGGEIQIWLAMAYEANNRHRDCIMLYQELEKKHPSVSIRRQAKELRYILQAPKLKISKDEMVTIPLIGSSYDRSFANTMPHQHMGLYMGRENSSLHSHYPTPHLFHGALAPPHPIIAHHGHSSSAPRQSSPLMTTTSTTSPLIRSSPSDP